MTATTSQLRDAHAAGVVRDQESALDEARDLLGALEERVRDGDQSVSPEDLDGAQRMVRFAELQVEAAHRAERQRMQEGAAREVAEASDEVREFLAHVSSLEKLVAAAQKAMKQLCDAADEQRAAGVRIGQRVVAANEAAQQVGVPESFEAEKVRGAADGLVARVDGERVEWRAPTYTGLVRSVLEEAGLKCSEVRGRGAV